MVECMVARKFYKVFEDRLARAGFAMGISYVYSLNPRLIDIK